MTSSYRVTCSIKMMYLFTDWSSVPRVTDEIFDGFDNKNLPAENTVHKNVIRKIQRNNILTKRFFTKQQKPTHIN